MYRKFGMLAVLVMALIMAFGAVSVTPAFATADDDVLLAQPDDDGKKPEGEGEEPEAKKDKPKSERKLYRDRARWLDAKTKQPGPPPQKPKYKPWGKVITRDHEKQEGLIEIYTKGDEMLFVFSEEDLDKPMLATMTLSQGIGSNFVFGGLPAGNIMFDFHREKDMLHVRNLSVMFRAPGDAKLEKAVDLTFSNSILASLKIESEKNGKIAVDMTKFYLSDVAGMSYWLGAVLRQPVRLSRDSNYFQSIKNYPENMEIDTRLTYSPGRPQVLNLPNVPDPRYIQVGIHYSIHKLPEDPMTPRIADDRVGYFPTMYKDFTRVNHDDFFVHYANRWRLEKKDPDAAMSEPVEPILFYIDRTVPEEYVQYIIEGVEWWQRAFEEAGFKNAIIAKPAPSPEEDPEYDPADARYNTIRWNTSDQVMYGAIGPSQVDPRTGEIFNADILFEHTMVANFGKMYRRLSAPEAMLMDIDPGLKQFWMTEEELEADVTMDDIPQLRGQGYRFCSLNDQMLLGGHFLGIHQMVNGYVDPDGEMPKEYMADALRFVAAHEVGHTLGLRHNFKSSGSTPYDKLNDKTTIAEIGMTGSVMDYPTPNVARNSDNQGYYYTPTVGTYDLWAIKWGYMPASGDDEWAQHAALEPIAEECIAKANYYGTDEDTYPFGAMDPRSNISDLSDQPLMWATERMDICDDLLKGGKLDDRLVLDGDNYLPLTRAVTTLLVQRYIATQMAVKNLGGNYTSRAHKGSPELPYEAVPASQQKEALDFIINRGLMSSNYELPPDLLYKLGDDKMWSWQNNPFQQGRRFDFPMSLWVATLQNALLTNLMMPMRQARIVEQSYTVEKPFKLSQLYSGLTRSIWTNNPTPRGKTAAWDRNLQRLYTQRLINQITMPYPGTPQDAMALSRLNLRRIRQTANDALQKPGLDDETNAHLMETIARIDRALDAKRMTMF